MPSSADPSADVHDARGPGASPPGREGARAGAAVETETTRLGARAASLETALLSVFERGGASRGFFAAEPPSRGRGVPFVL